MATDVFPDTKNPLEYRAILSMNVQGASRDDILNMLLKYTVTDLYGNLVSTGSANTNQRRRPTEIIVFSADNPSGARTDLKGTIAAYDKETNEQVTGNCVTDINVTGRTYTNQAYLPLVRR